IGAFWDEMSALYGREKLVGLGCNWTKDSIEYVIGLKEGILPNPNYEIELPEEWMIIKGNTKELGYII
ncbi:MAG: hypothetical protein KBT48_02305, partial [Firmicutes bacterium]|nr:hypothetical protein [Bacillota bacterium]